MTYRWLNAQAPARTFFSPASAGKMKAGATGRIPSTQHSSASTVRTPVARANTTCATVRNVSLQTSLTRSDVSTTLHRLGRFGRTTTSTARVVRVAHRRVGDADRHRRALSHTHSIGGLQAEVRDPFTQRADVRPTGAQHKVAMFHRTSKLPRRFTACSAAAQLSHSTTRTTCTRSSAS